mmetsp:Transcript_4605/g.11430  ORF Transcript_4605/g.11430 Transcript_4605/m.11430 type:complete len:209 (-) Transcript_4605:257-883(-)
MTFSACGSKVSSLIWAAFRNARCPVDAKTSWTRARSHISRFHRLVPFLRIPAGIQLVEPSRPSFLDQVDVATVQLALDHQLQARMPRRSLPDRNARVRVRAIVENAAAVLDEQLDGRAVIPGDSNAEWRPQVLARGVGIRAGLQEHAHHVIADLERPFVHARQQRGGSVLGPVAHGRGVPLEDKPEHVHGVLAHCDVHGVQPELLGGQ